MCGCSLLQYQSCSRGGGGELQRNTHSRKRKHSASMSGKDAAQAGPLPLWTLVCPITNALFEEPVVATDGRTYSKQALSSLIASCAERGLPVTSPFGDALSEKLEPDVKMAAAVRKYREERAARMPPRAAAGPVPSRPAAQRDAASSQPVKSIAELGRVFALLDGSLRELLAATLDGWQPPQVVVVGEESSGKSSVLERLMMTPLLPRAENICTRLPIHVRLRRSDRALPPKLEVFNLTTNTTERGEGAREEKRERAGRCRDAEANVTGRGGHQQHRPRAGV